MSALVKAEIDVLDRNGGAERTVQVQFNPTTLQLQMANSIEGGQSRGRQVQQYNGTSSTTLSLDLEFDTADEGTSANPVDVRDRTGEIAQFVLPRDDEGSKSAPPRLKFRWGTFELVGIMSSLTEELSFFSSDGVPLRAKVSVQIKEQDPKFEALETGPGANAGGGAPPAGEGGRGGGALDRAAAALAGETPADFLARNGLDPQAWRGLGLGVDLSAGLELSAGVEIGFSSQLALGVGVSAGVHAGVELSASAALDLAAGGSAATAGTGASAASGASSTDQPGLALSAAGGLTAATEQAAVDSARAAADTARTNFGAAGDGAAPGADAGGSASTSPAASPSPVAAARAPIAATTAPRTAAAVPSPKAAPPPRADRRAVSFGRDVPLRDRVQPLGAQPDAWVVIGGADPTAPAASHGRAAPWERLAPSVGRDAADREQHARRPPCGCRRCDPFGPSGRRR